MLYPSIDSLLQKVSSKYLLVNIAAKRTKEMEETDIIKWKKMNINQLKILAKP